MLRRKHVLVAECVVVVVVVVVVVFWNGGAPHNFFQIFADTDVLQVYQNLSTFNSNVYLK